jgi:actin-related protein 3
MYKDFARRLHRDIKRMVDARVMQSQITSQLNMSSDQQITAKQIDVNVVSHKKQRYAVWFGGSLLADTV